MRFERFYTDFVGGREEYFWFHKCFPKIAFSGTHHQLNYKLFVGKTFRFGFVLGSTTVISGGVVPVPGVSSLFVLTVGDYARRAGGRAVGILAHFVAGKPVDCFRFLLILGPVCSIIYTNRLDLARLELSSTPEQREGRAHPRRLFLSD